MWYNRPMIETPHILDHLQRLQHLTGKSFHGPSFYDLILTHGRGFKPHKRPRGVPRGTVKECFKNALQLAQSNPKYTYVEGFGLRFIPIHHAWVVDQDGNAIDNTWEISGEEYFGVPIDTSYVEDHTNVSGTYGVLWNHGNIAILSDEPSNFLCKVHCK